MPQGLRIGLLGALAAILLSRVLVMIERHHQQAQWVEEDLAKRDRLPQGLPTFDDLGPSFSPHILADSIISIVQNYYVDGDRVERPTRVLRWALPYLDHMTALAIEERPGRFTASVGEQRQTFVLDESMGYDRLIDTVVALGAMVDQDSGSARARADEGAEVERRGVEIVLNAILLSLDAHTSLLSREAYRELRQGTDGSFGGLGVLVGIRDHLLTVIRPLPHSPALRVGINSSDRILAINGVATYGASLNALVEHMRGPPGTRVILRLLGEEAWAWRDVELEREVILVDSVEHELRPSGALYLRIESFAMRTSQEVAAAIAGRDLSAGLIIDLRGNPGGLLDQAVEVADLFLPTGTIVSTRGKKVDHEEATFRPEDEGFPIVVLMDEDSASASEIVAGALKDQNRGVIVGRPSFGKGSVQTVFELPQDQALKLTIARYYTPSGGTIQNRGIMPDVWNQPVWDGKENHNLLGSYRYRNEFFLLNKLQLKDRHRALRHRAPRYKGYFPVGKGDEEDFDLRVAEELLAASVREDTGWRAHQILEGAGRSVEALHADSSERVAESLARQFGVDWRAPAASDALALQIRLTGDGPLMAQPGDRLQLPFVISNLSPKAQGRVSVFIRGIDVGIDTTEKLIGWVEGASELTGHLDLHVPASLEPGTLRLQLGLAVDARTVPHSLTPLTYTIRSRLTPMIDVQAVLEDSPKGLHGVLEDGESAEVLVRLVNRSSVPAHDLSLRLLNLTGRQVELGDAEETLRRIRPWKTRVVRIPIQAGERLVARRIDLGVLVSSDTLQGPVRKRVSIPSAKGQVKK